jgi:hypothetical protein
VRDSSRSNANNATSGGPGTLNAHRQNDDDDDAFPTTHKMEFHKYNSVGDPLPWLNRCAWYFSMRRTPELRRMVYSSFYLTDDAQLWHHQLELNASLPPWHRFI